MWRRVRGGDGDVVMNILQDTPMGKCHNDFHLCLSFLLQPRLASNFMQVRVTLTFGSSCIHIQCAGSQARTIVPGWCRPMAYAPEACLLPIELRSRPGVCCFIFYFMCMVVSFFFLACVYVCTPCLVPLEAFGRSPEFGITDGYEPQWVLGIEPKSSGRAVGTFNS